MIGGDGNGRKGIDKVPSSVQACGNVAKKNYAFATVGTLMFSNFFVPIAQLGP